MPTTTVPTIDVTAPGFDPWDPRYASDPYPVYAAMLEQQPLHYNDVRGLWFATRFEDVTWMLKDFARLSTAVFHIDKPHMREPPADGERYQGFKDATMITVEPPEQKRLRRGAAPSFSAKAMRQMVPGVEAIADELLDGLAQRDEFDLVDDFAYPLPIRAIAVLLGIPDRELEEFIALATDEKGASKNDPNATAETLARAEQNGARLNDLVRRVIGIKRADPQDDLVTTMVRAEQAGEMTEAEIVAAVHLMMEAGHTTTVNLIANGVDALLDRPDELRKLRADPSLLPDAVEELVRFAGPVHFTGRTALEDVDVDGRLVRKGETIITMLAAANRDPAVFDAPHELRVDRPRSRNLGFGIGAHVCIGAALARMETEVALRKLNERFPTLGRAGETGWNGSFEIWGVNRLPVRCR